MLKIVFWKYTIVSYTQKHRNASFLLVSLGHNYDVRSLYWRHIVFIHIRYKSKCRFSFHFVSLLNLFSSMWYFRHTFRHYFTTIKLWSCSSSLSLLSSFGLVSAAEFFLCCLFLRFTLFLLFSPPVLCFTLPLPTLPLYFSFLLCNW